MSQNKVNPWNIIGWMIVIGMVVTLAVVLFFGYVVFGDNPGGGNTIPTVFTNISE